MSETVDTEPDVSLRATRALSKSLFGGATYRIEIGAAIADGDGIVNTAGLADELNLVRQSVNQELKILETIGLLERREQADGGRKVFLMRNVSTYWKWCREAQENAVEMLGRKEPF
jgi:predicted transcriptional regulator